MPKHVDETSKQGKEILPNGAPKTFSAGTATGRLAVNQQVQIAREAWNRQENKSVEWEELDGERQRSYFDTSVDIYERGGGSSEFEQKVQELKAEVAAGAFVLDEPGPITPAPPDPPVVLMTEAEKREVVEQAEADRKRGLTDEERRELIQYEQRRRFQEAGRPKLQPVAGKEKATTKNKDFSEV